MNLLFYVFFGLNPLLLMLRNAKAREATTFGFYFFKESTLLGSHFLYAIYSNLLGFEFFNFTIRFVFFGFLG